MPRDPQRPVATNRTPLRRREGSSGTPSSLGEAAAAWSRRRGRLLAHTPRQVTCERCRDTGIAGYSLERGDEYCVCLEGQAEEARVRRWYDAMHVEDLAWRRQVLEERIAAFSARVLPGGQIPTLETLPPSEALLKVRAFVETRTDEQGLVLLGEVGVGKTTLLLALVRSLAGRWLAARKVVRLVTVPDFLRELRAGYDAARQKQSEGYEELMERYQTCDVLVFDDLGAEKLTDWVEEQFYLLVDYRYRQRLPVLASSNCRKEVLAQRLDRRVMDRLRETCAMVEVTGPNQRDRTVQRG
jgi:DNA replication protein DnaC